MMENPKALTDKASIIFDLLKLAARVHVDEETGLSIQKLVDDDISWQLLIQLMEYHGVGPVVAVNLATYTQDKLPENVQSYFGKKKRALALKNAFFLEELGRLIHRFKDAKVPMISFKGPVLAQVAYGDTNLRQYVDLDLLIRTSDFETARRMLLGAEYRPFSQVAAFKGAREKLYIWQAGQYPFQRGRGLFNLDLHTRLMPQLYKYPFRFDTLYERAENVCLTGNHSVVTFSTEDRLHLLCYHGVKNRWERLKYVCDISEVINSSPAIDWDVVFARAETARGVRVLHLGLLMAHRLLRSGIPDEIISRIKRDEAIGRIASDMEDHLENCFERPEQSYWERTNYHLAIQDNNSTKARYIFFSGVRRLFGVS